MKPPEECYHVRKRQLGFPRHRAAASLKPQARPASKPAAAGFSAASGRGLIEAYSCYGHELSCSVRFSAASGRGLIEAVASASAGLPRPRFSAASGRGLIEAVPTSGRRNACTLPRFSAASGRGLIEACRVATQQTRCAAGFPRHRAAASLKRDGDVDEGPAAGGFPRHRAAASLKHTTRTGASSTHPPVFRGIGPRPH